MELTKEQQAILTSFLKWDNLRINAFAWTWKTTTLKMLANSTKDKKFLVLAFNKKVADELTRQFPMNANAFTTHSFALKFIRDRIKFKVSWDKSLLPAIIEEFWVTYEQWWFLYKTFIDYCNSSLISINILNVNRLIQAEEKLKIVFKKHIKWKLWFTRILHILNQIQVKILNWDIEMFHWFYLKYFQLHLDEFLPLMNYDIIMLDEWQDTNEVTIDIFNRLQWQKVIVWDSHQSIYWWRWAVDAMEKFDYKLHYLSTSFRINTDTAKKADNILKHIKLEKNKFKEFFKDWAPSNKKACMIFRTNTWIIRHIAYNVDETLDKIHFTRDVKDIFKMALDMEKVKRYYSTGDADQLTRLPKWILLIIDENDTADKFEKFITTNVYDSEMVGSWKLSKDLNIFTLYYKALKVSAKYSNYYISTAHSVKWLEFDEVIIENDFASIFKILIEWFIWELWYSKWKVKRMFFDKSQRSKSPMIQIMEEINLMYVAITRAIKTLDIKSKAIEEIIDTTADNFLTKLQDVESSMEEKA